MARVCEFAVDGHGLFVARRRILSTRIDVELVFRRLWVAALYSSGIQSTRAWRYGVAQEADIAMWFELQDTCESSGRTNTSETNTFKQRTFAWDWKQGARRGQRHVRQYI